jgi:hypothetical protein
MAIFEAVTKVHTCCLLLSLYETKIDTRHFFQYGEYKFRQFIFLGPSQWMCDSRRGSVAAPLLGLRVRWRQACVSLVRCVDR